MASKGTRGRSAALAVLTTLLLTGSIIITMPATAQVPVAQADFAGFANGVITHADVLDLGALAGGAAGGTRLLDVETGFSGASVNSKGLNTALSNEMKVVFSPAQGGKLAYGRGSGLEVGLLQSLPVETNTLVLAQRAEAASPPATDLVKREIGPVKLDPIAYASLLRGEAQARFDPNSPVPCPLGADLSYGRGFAADAQLVGGAGAGIDGLLNPLLGTAASSPERRSVDSRSRTRFIGTGRENVVGLMSEIRETVAPVTLFKGTPGELTIEVLGEWALRAEATGSPGGARIVYSQGSVTSGGSPAAADPILRIVQGSPPVVSDILTAGQLGNLLNPVTTLVSSVTGNLVEITIGEQPRPISRTGTITPGPVTPAADGTFAEAAVDVARVRLLPAGTNLLGGLLGGLQLADIRVGHMEVSSRVPAGGILCPGIPVTKDSDPRSVTAGQEFTYIITVQNPFDCTLRSVKVVDTITPPAGATFTVVDAGGGTVSGNTVTFNNVADIPPKSNRELRIRVRVNSGSGGNFNNRAVPTGICDDIPLRGEVNVPLPALGGPGRALPITGGPTSAYVAGGLLLGLLGVYGLRRARRLAVQ